MIAAGQSPEPARSGDPADTAALAVIEGAEPRYLRLLGLTESHDEWQEPESFCRDLLARALAHPSFLGVARRRRFFEAAVRARPRSRLLPVLAALDHLARGETGPAWAAVQRALALNKNDLFAQTLWRRAHPAPPAERPLQGRFCELPFENVETQTGDRAYVCCPSWLPVVIGNLEATSLDEVWNSRAARDIRRSVLRGDFRYCSRLHCPRLTQDTLPHAGEVVDAAHAETIRTGRVELAQPPRRLNLAHDRSCNLSCPSCRTTTLVARGHEVDRHNRMVERLILPHVGATRSIQVCGSGDPFASRHFRWVLARLTDGTFPGVRIRLLTHGLLLEDSWDELRLDGYVERAIISVDAARAETYEVVRRGGDFSRLVRNLEFASRLRREGRLPEAHLAFVVQGANYREMPEFVALASGLGFDGVVFQLLRSWGTWTPEAFARHDIGAPEHPEHGAFLAVLDDPGLRGPSIQFHGFHSVDPKRLRALH